MGADLSRPYQVNRHYQYGPAYYLRQCGGGMQCLCVHPHQQRRYVYRDPYGHRNYDPFDFMMSGGQYPRHWADPSDWSLRDIETMGNVMRDVHERMEFDLSRHGPDRRYGYGGGYGRRSDLDMFRLGNIVREHDRRIDNLEDYRHDDMRRMYHDYFYGGGGRFGGGVPGMGAIAMAQAGGSNFTIGGNDMGWAYRQNDFGNRHRDIDERRQNERRDHDSNGNGRGGSNSSRQGNRQQQDHPFLINMNNVRIGNWNDLEHDLVYPMYDQHRNQDGRRFQHNPDEDYEPYNRFS